MQQQKICYLCGAEKDLEEHHIFGGVANRKISEKYGMKVWLCHEHHTGKNGAQYNRNVNQGLKRLAQIAFEARHSHDEWMQIIRKNYL